MNAIDIVYSVWGHYVIRCEDPELVWKHMRDDGYFIGDDRLLGMPAEFRQHFHSTYFTEDVLRRYPDDVPADRERARDVIHYAWTSPTEVALTEHDTIAIPDRHGRRGPREFARIELLRDAMFSTWVTGVLSLVPVESRLARGTFGVNLFRTRTQVVTGPHRDHEQFIVVYVLDKVGTGAETSLHNGDEVVVGATLQPGEFVIFDDSRYKHSASPLISPPGAEARRDALVCTVDYPAGATAPVARRPGDD
ncbi:2OG-Fe dioxygenase family protein [Actinocrispum wychmicini]|uniref:2-oxoglutarate-Fe(II)-dependent dioxygenase family protein n=1 Tax=Actinocrispum wychmicini TaxID=1213861 RepID=A0A4R2JNL6_9PSEU|nr:2OG-Fe dioxygenase family protein [Actinocrispum wychmicini]TCO58728.1 2-oxoglutarate-Fe(II)-dependent dioxygenase family protein [Actinocrispum wychmicini]